jgi:hypothetical protein
MLPKSFKIRQQRDKAGGRLLLLLCVCVCWGGWKREKSENKRKIRSGWSKRINGNKLRKMPTLTLKTKIPSENYTGSWKWATGKCQESITWVMLNKQTNMKCYITLSLGLSQVLRPFRNSFPISFFHYEKNWKGSKSCVPDFQVA